MPVTNAANVMNMLERLPIAVVISDIATGEILWVNGPHARLSGAESPDRIIGRSLFDFLSPDQLTIAMRDVEAVGRGESPAPVTYHVRKLDGTAADVQIASTSMMYGRRPAMVSFVTDVTDSERAISDLARREARYRAMVDESPAGIFVSIREGLAYANAAFARMLGAETPDRLLGTAGAGVLHSARLHALSCMHGVAFAQSSAVRPVGAAARCRFRAGGGTMRCVQAGA